MNRTMIAALTLIGAALAAVPASAQNNTKSSAIPQQQEAQSSGAMPSQSAFSKAAPSGLTKTAPQTSGVSQGALTPNNK